VIFWINSDFVIILAMLCYPGFRSSTIAGIRTEKSKTSPICTALFRSCALAVCCFTPNADWPRGSRVRAGIAGAHAGLGFRIGQGPKKA
jgi:hypothetical protein